MRYGLYLFFCLLFTTLSVSAQHVDNPPIDRQIERQMEALRREPYNKEILKNIGMLSLNRADFESSMKYGGKLLELAYADGDTYYTMYAHICLGQTHIMKGNATEAYNHLHQALSIARLDLKDDEALCSIYNGLGLYAANIEKDYYRSIEYFMEGIEISKRCGNQRLYSLMLGNLANIYLLKYDAAGLQYALECYDVGHRTKDSYLIYCGSLSLAYMYWHMQEYDTALGYIREAESQMFDNDFYDRTNVYCIYGYITMDTGGYDKAAVLFRKALEEKDTGNTSSIVNTCLGYGKLFMKRGEYSQAINMLKQAQEVSRKGNSKIFLNEVLENMALCYQMQGEYRNALDYFRRYQEEVMDQFNTDRERSLNDMRVKYDTERTENLLRQKELTLLRKEKRIQLAVAAAVCFAVATLLLYLLYKRKNKLYMTIVRQNTDALRREKNLRKQLESQNEKSPVPPLSCEKSSDIMSRLDRLMREERIYSDNFLTKEKTADLLGTNRTYLSRIINEQTRQTFTQYVNAFRIEEAVRTISDAEDDTPLKALCVRIGFSSMTTFHNIFRSTMGMTPAQYRQKVRELHRKP